MQRWKFSLLLALGTGLAIAGCTGGGEPRPVASAQSAGHTVVLATPTGQLRSGPNDVTVSFTDAAGAPAAVQAPSLRFFMPPMGTMAAMVAEAPLEPTEKPGVYRGRADLSMKGDWQATLTYRDAAGPQKASMAVIAR